MSRLRAPRPAARARACSISWQQRVETEDGRLIPDVIIHLPGGGNIVVDAKTPMQAFLDACAADDDEAKARLLEQHAAVTRRHIAHLSSKGYGAEVDPSPDFVVMYLPVESAFTELMRADFTIMEDAAKRDVMLAGPLVLIPLLRAVAFGWRQHRVEKPSKSVEHLPRSRAQSIGVDERRSAFPDQFVTAS